jgi:hypothetical protein
VAQEHPKGDQEERRDRREDRNQRLARLTLAIWWRGRVHSLDHGSFAALVQLGHLELTRKQVEQGLLVLELAEAIDVVALGGRLVDRLETQQLSAQCTQFPLRLHQLRCPVGQIAAQSLNAHLGRGGLRQQPGVALGGRLGFGPQGALRDAGGLQCLLSGREAILRLCQLALEEQTPLLGLGDRQFARQAP